MRAAIQFSKWGLSSDTIEHARLFETLDASEIDPDYPREPAVVIPYFDLAGEPVEERNGATFHRIRRLRDALPKRAGKYLQPPRTRPHVYFPPMAALAWPETARDTTCPVIITEGEAKALRGAQDGLPCIALGGVYSFAGRNGELLPDLAQFAWDGRQVVIVFDSDAATNPHVRCAESRLVAELQGRRRARCRVVRLPPAPDGAKQGLDDFLIAHGPEELEALMLSAPEMSGLDSRLIALNTRYAWIEQEGAVYSAADGLFIRKTDFVKGAAASAEKYLSPGGGRNNTPKSISVPDAWLTSHLAQRYSEVLFRPGRGAVVETDSRAPALNLWNGWPSHEAGDVQPFLDLTKWIFQHVQPEHADFPLRWLAFKAQNPQVKIPIAIVITGHAQGSGKTLWAEIARDAFAPYSCDIPPSALRGEFRGWMERSLLAVVQEASPRDMVDGAESLKSLISDLRQSMNEKFRPARQIEAYTQFIITSNHRAAGSFGDSDRRMFVANGPDAAPDEFYERIGAWRRAGGGRHVLHHLLNFDLQGWQPPARAPLTAEKALAHAEGLTPLQQLAEQMREAAEHTIVFWLQAASAWAERAEVGQNTVLADQARAVKEAISNFAIRPWYTPEELALMFPAIIAEATGHKAAQITPGALSRQLRDAGIPYLICSDSPRGFLWHGRLRQFLVIADMAEWRNPLSQAEFDRYMRGWPTFGVVKQMRRAS